MGGWVADSTLMLSAFVGVLGLLVGWGLSRWRYQQRVNRLADEHQRVLQELDTKLTAAQGAHQRTQQALADRESTLHQQAEALAEAQGAAARLVDVQATLAAAQEEQARLQAECAQLYTTQQTHEGMIQEQAATLAAAQQAYTNARRQLAQLQAAADAQQQQFAQIQHAYQSEIALRHGFTAEIAALYHRLRHPTNNHTAPVLIGAAVSPNLHHAALPSTPPNGSVTEALGTEVTLTATQAKLTHFLAERGITIKQIPAEVSTDPIINSLADFLGSHYEALKPFYQQIKRNMQQGDDFTLSLKEETPTTISLICQFGKKLYDVAFLEQYRYFRSPQYLLRAKTTRLPTALNFFSGQWLERYVMQQVQAAVDTVQQTMTQPIDFGYMTNPRITLPNGQDGELDLLFYINDAVYWVETKSGDYQQHISKYSAITQTLQLDPQHALMVLTDIPPSRSTELTLLFDMGVCALADFTPALQSTLVADLTNHAA